MGWLENLLSIYPKIVSLKDKIIFAAYVALSITLAVLVVLIAPYFI